MKRFIAIASILIALMGGSAAPAQTAPAQTSSGAGSPTGTQHRLRVITTLPDYADFARRIGGDLVTVSSIVQGDQDAHFIRPKPSFVQILREADLLIATGLDLEMWLPTAVDKSGNQRIRSEAVGYVAAAQGVHMKEVPTVLSRSEGGLHIYGNPHVTVSPLNMYRILANIAIGLEKNLPGHIGEIRQRLAENRAELCRRLYGPDLVEILGGETLINLHQEGKLHAFLEKNVFEGKPLIGMLGGWMGRMLPLRGLSLITYHKNWGYFCDDFDLVQPDTIEPKPGIPPSPKHTRDLEERMKREGIRIILAASYFDEQTVRKIAEATGARYRMVPYYVGGSPAAKTYFDLVDLWVGSLVEMAEETGSSRTAARRPATPVPGSRE